MILLFVYYCWILCGIHLITSSPCQNNQHAGLEGEWVLNRKLAKTNDDPSGLEPGKSFYCCDDLTSKADRSGIESMDQNFCAPLMPVTTATDSFDLKVVMQGNSTYPSPTGGHACFCSHRAGSKTIMTNQESYTWKPASCELSAWNGQEFCALLGDRTLLLSGDSTMYQCASTLMSMLAYSKANCTEQVYFGRSDYLYLRRAGEKRFDEYVEDFRPDIAVITAGAWLQDHGDLENVFREVDHYIALLKTKPDLKIPQFVWKTQNPGHVKCSRFSHPISKDLFDDMADYYKEKMVKPAGVWTGLDPYFWHMHPEFDSMAREWAAARSFPILDMSPLYLRPDSHSGKYDSTNTDCLHYCLPGPLDLFARVLLQMLKNKEI